MTPVKRINEVADVQAFLISPARKRLSAVVESMSLAVAGIDVPAKAGDKTCELARKVLEKLGELSTLIDEVPPVETPQRFGNPSYRIWLEKAEKDFSFGNDELDYYFFHAFGSSQRIDYGTGHELSFVAFWDGLTRSNGVEKVSGSDILLVFSHYFDLCRKLILTYKLEPAGSHGVWGLDDHFHIPYILGAGQLAANGPGESPSPKDIMNQKVVAEFRDTNMYFCAIAFIYQVKRGAFFEHSPVLFDISAVPSWSKIRSGLIKMYNAEVLGKFPVVQHFYFGELFPFTDDAAKADTKTPSLP